MDNKYSVYTVNTVDELNNLEATVQAFYDSKHRIDEVRFKTRELRRLFQDKILQRFIKVYEGTDLKINFDVDRLFNTEMTEWITQYGIIKLNDLEASNQVKTDVRIRRA